MDLGSLKYERRRRERLTAPQARKIKARGKRESASPLVTLLNERTSPERAEFCGEVPQKVIANRKNPCIIPQPVVKVTQNTSVGSVKTEASDLRFLTASNSPTASRICPVV